MVWDLFKVPDVLENKQLCATLRTQFQQCTDFHINLTIRISALKYFAKKASKYSSAFFAP